MRRQDCSRITLFVLGLGALAGCSNALETGYVPRALGASSTERRGYYASPFTPEAAAAQQAHTGDVPTTCTRPTGRRDIVDPLA